jgi:hypothetical protein
MLTKTVHAGPERLAGTRLRPCKGPSRNLQVIKERLEAGIQRVEVHVWRDDLVLERQRSTDQASEASRSFGMSNDSLNGADVERLIAIIRRVKCF